MGEGGRRPGEGIILLFYKDTAPADAVANLSKSLPIKD